LALTKVTEDMRTLGTGEVAIGNISGSAAGAAGTFLKQDGTWAEAATDTTTIEDDIALLGFKVAVAGTMAKYNLVDQTEDAFMDPTGIDALASTGEIRNAANYYSGISAASVTATGGTISVDGDYTVHKFTGNGNFVTDTEQDVRIMLIAGGGSGGVDAGGGGGAGGMVDTGAYNFTVSAATHAVVIGTGGASVGGVSGGNRGLDSTFSTLTAKGGGGAGGWTGASTDGGSGGGGAQTSGNNAGSAGIQPSQSGDSGTYGYGNLGPSGASSVDAGGGGGAGAAGSGRTGGSGKESNILVAASNVFYAGGGGGAAMSGSTTGSSPGGGGTGAAGVTHQSGGAGTVNTGSGGGGGAGGGAATSGAGGSGLFALRRETSVDVVGNMVLQSNSTTANDGAPTKGDIVMTYTNGIAGAGGIAAINTDLTAEFSADNGSTWTSATLVAQGTTGTHLIVSAHDVTRTSTSGTSMVYRIKTLNQGAAKETRIQAVSLGWS
jgi:hypothetical protein